MAYDYYSSGARDERTLRENVAAWARIPLHHRVLVDVSSRDLSTTVLGAPVSMPILVAPTAFHRLACEEGELATARAAARSRTVMILSSLSNTGVEQVCAVSEGAPLWFQLYVYRDRTATEALVARAEDAGASAIVLTVDAPLFGRRERDVRNRFHLPDGLRVENMTAAGHADMPERGAESGLNAYIAEKLDQSLTWKDVAWLRSATRLPVVVKGIARPDDAVRAIDHGASAIVVSNHGGRQLDGSPATATVLGPIADAVQGRIEVLEMCIRDRCSRVARMERPTAEDVLGALMYAMMAQREFIVTWNARERAGHYERNLKGSRGRASRPRCARSQPVQGPDRARCAAPRALRARPPRRLWRVPKE